MYVTLEQLFVKVVNGKSFEVEFEKVTKFYGDDFNSDVLKVQLKTLPAVIKVNDEIVDTFYDVRKLVKELKKPLRAFINEVVKIMRLMIVMPATNAVSERSFSTMRRLFIYLRTNMGSNRLNNTIVLHIHKERLDRISLVDIANDFVKGIDYRQTIFGSFDSVDIRQNRVSVKSVGVQVNMKNIYINMKKHIYIDFIFYSRSLCSKYTLYVESVSLCRVYHNLLDKVLNTINERLGKCLI